LYIIGEVTKYYKCVGCVVENAMGCITDMRNNKTGNVEAPCRFNMVFNQVDKVLFEGSGKYKYSVSASTSVSVSVSATMVVVVVVVVVL
jgi:hypothetical protein